VTDLIQIRPAHISEAPHLARLLALAFQADPVSCWLIPDPGERYRRQPDFFRVFIDQAFIHGEVHTTEDRQAVALWFSINPGATNHEEEVTEQRLREALGPSHTAFSILARLMNAVHPMAIHHAYLPFIGVQPQLWEHGIGRRLMQYKLAALDATGTPSYLEASSERSRTLYQRLGYRQLPQLIPLPNGPMMYPMWREPQGCASPAHANRSGR
jgi:ribosomal protein S18 acetylase RimI-like enzyme